MAATLCQREVSEREECTAISWPTMETQRLLNLFNVSAFCMAPLSPRPARRSSVCVASCQKISKTIALASGLVISIELRSIYNGFH